MVHKKRNLLILLIVLFVLFIADLMNNGLVSRVLNISL